MLKLLVFGVLTVFLAYLSRASLRDPRSHGLYRFGAWEIILALLLMNLDDWFREPFTGIQLVSWGLLAVSVVLVVYGAYSLRVLGNPDPGRRDDSQLLGIEKTTSLVTDGAYRYIRHPLYSSMLFGAWGIFLKDVSWWGAILACAANVLVVITAKVEEVECVRYFGASYQVYMKRTKMLVPFL